MNRWFFHWASWVGDPPHSRASPPRLVLRGGHRLVKFPNVSWVTRWVGSPWGISPTFGPTLKGSRKKKVHTKRGKDIIWWTWRIGSSFCWISIGFVLLVIFFKGEVVGPGTGQLRHDTLWLKEKTFGPKNFHANPSRHLFRNFFQTTSIFVLPLILPPPHPPPPSSRMDVDFSPQKTAWPSLAPRAWRSTAWARPKVQRPSPSRWWCENGWRKSRIFGYPPEV